MPNTKKFANKFPHGMMLGTYHDKAPKIPGPRDGNMFLGCRVTFNFVKEPWTPENEYNFYDVVNVSGTSYIASKDVPSGTDIHNENFWIRFAEPNAQIQELYDIVSGFNARITALEEKVGE